MAKHLGKPLGLNFKTLLAILCMTMIAGSVLLCMRSNGQESTATVPQQKRLAFVVATIKPSQEIHQMSFSYDSKGTLKATLPLRSLIAMAYGLRDFQVVGSQKGIDSVYDINAQSDEQMDARNLTPREQDALVDRQNQRLQSLLADRFHLKLQHATSEVPVYALVVAKGGPKLKMSKETDHHKLDVNHGMFIANSVSMAELADRLSVAGVDKFVIDKTGIAGNYDFMLNPAPAMSPEAYEESLSSVLQQQLGLRLVAQKESIPVLVVTAIEKPTNK